MRYPRWLHLLLATLALQLSTVDPLWAQGELSFTRQDFGVGDTPVSVTVGDFDIDGQQDVATANGSADTVSILLGNGDGTFEAAQDFGVGVRPASITVGDFNGDGRQDPATANSNADTVSVVLGNGDGTFEPAQDFGVGDGPSSVTVGDFNGDGRQDLATSNVTFVSESVSILLGRGDGTFEPAQDFPVGEAPSTFGHTPVSVTVGDFNGDSQQDLATANVNSQTVSVLLGNGDGTFEPAQDFGLGEPPFSVTVGDFNGDGRQDLATANGGARAVFVLLGNGDGTFEAALGFAAGVRQPLSVAAGDFNGDGRQDLATANFIGTEGSASVLLGRGDGTFEPAQEFATGPLASRVTVGDFNSDGQQDLATANIEDSTVTILINVTSRTYRLTRIGDEVFSPIVSDINETGEIVGSTRGITEPRRAILLRDGIVTELGDLMGGAAPSASASAINDRIQITGVNDVQDASGNRVTRGFLWEGGQIRDLGVDPGASPLDINNRGEIVGVSVSGDNIARPFVWQAGSTTFLETLFCPGNLGGSARAINNNGVIVGSSTSTVGRRAVIWQAGGVGITPLEPPFMLEVGEAVDVNDRGDVIGFYFNSSGPQMDTALLWQADEVTVLLPLDHPEANGAIPASINNLGQIVGHTHLGSGQSLATLWRGSAVLDLNALVSDDDPAKDFVTLAFAIRITDSGLIVASGTDSREPEPRDTVYYLLSPTGAPATAPSTSAPSPSASSSPPPSDNGGGAVDRVLLLLLVIVLSASATCARRRLASSACR